MGVSVQMDMSYTTIPVEGNLIKLYVENKMLHLIEDPNSASYEVLYADVDVDNCSSYVDFKEHEIDKCKYPEQVGSPWILMFDGSYSKFGNGVGVFLISLNKEELNFSFKLNFECTNILQNMKHFFWF